MSSYRSKPINERRLKIGQLVSHRCDKDGQPIVWLIVDDGWVDYPGHEWEWKILTPLGVFDYVQDWAELKVIK